MIKLICVGKTKESFVKEGVSEFAKRIDRFEIIEVKDSNPKKEAEEIVSKIKNEKVFLLDEKGKEYTSEEFSSLVKKEMIDKNLVFVIGGPSGFSEELKNKYPKIALSKMTFTHELARLFFVEQLYRALTKNKAYWK